MTYTIQLKDSIVLLVEVPNHTIDVKLKQTINTEKIAIAIGGDKIIWVPWGSWELIGTTPLTEEQAGMVVELSDGCKMSYRRYGEEPWRVTGSSTESFASLLTAHNIPVGRYAVLIDKKEMI